MEVAAVDQSDRNARRFQSFCGIETAKAAAQDQNTVHVLNGCSGGINLTRLPCAFRADSGRRELIAGAPGEARTPDLLIRSQSLYPTELRARSQVALLIIRMRKFNQRLPIESPRPRTFSR